MKHGIHRNHDMKNGQNPFADVRNHGIYVIEDMRGNDQTLGHEPTWCRVTNLKENTS